MVLGNTFHLFLSPGHELIEQLGGLHRFQRWDRPIITDSGGFQVFSMGHGTVADEIKGRAAQFVGERSGAILAIEEEGVRFRSYLDGSTQFMGPETSMEVQAALRLGHRAGVRRVHAVPRRPRLHRALDRAHPPLARPLPGLARRSTDPRARSSTGSSRAASRRTCAARPRRRSPRATPRRDRDRRLARRGQGADVRGRRVDDRGAAGGQAAPPARDRRGRRPRPRRRARHRHLRLRDADPDRPPRHGGRPRPGEALARRPRQGALEGGRRAAARRLPVPGLRATATPAPTSTTCSRPRSRPRCACSRSTTSPTSSA